MITIETNTKILLKMKIERGRWKERYSKDKVRNKDVNKNKDVNENKDRYKSEDRSKDKDE